MAKQKEEVVKIKDCTVNCENYAELLDIDKINPHPANPYKHPEEQIAKLAKVYQSTIGITRPIWISRRSGLITGGHCRLASAKLIGLDKFPVAYVKYDSESDELAALIEDNKIAELSITENSKIGEIILELDQNNYQLELTALTDEEVAYYIEGPVAPIPNTDIQGEVEGLSDYIIVQFDNEIEIQKFRKLLDLKDNQKVVEYELLKKQFNLA